MAILGWKRPPAAEQRGQRRDRLRVGRTHRARFAPLLEGLEERALLSTLTVMNNADSGSGSLRDKIAGAGSGDIINFSSSLAGKTITLTSGEIAFDISLSIQGLGASSLAVSGNSASRIFNIGPDATAVTVAGLTIENGLSDQGGAILDDGSSLALTSCTLTNNQAVGTPGSSGSNGFDGTGGTLVILGESTAGMTVTISGCKFLSNTATGGAGGATDGINHGGSGGAGVGGAIFVDAQTSAGLSFTASGTKFDHNSAAGGAGGTGVGLGGLAQGGAIAVQASLSSGAVLHLSTDTFTNGNRASGGTGGDGDTFGGPTAGGDAGAAQGGAVWIDAGTASQPLFAFSSDTFSNCVAASGRGGDGVSGDDGGRGGDASGGALFYSANTAAGPVLTINASAFIFNFADAGAGGNGGRIDSTGFAGKGGFGGDGTGGAVAADFLDSAGGIDTFTRDNFSRNAARGGDGGTGGANGPDGNGGDAGDSGQSLGGGLEITISGYASGTQLTIARSAIANNLSQSGSGGGGGTGGTGGFGGSSHPASGGGLRFDSVGGAGLGDTWTFDSDTIANNQAISGNGGTGGTGTNGTGGSGGSANPAQGGGVYDAFQGALHILHSAIIRNQASSGVGGLGGTGTTGNGGNGGRFLSDAGGIFIVGTVCKTKDTTIAGNQADFNPNVDGTIGAC